MMQQLLPDQTMVLTVPRGTAIAELIDLRSEQYASAALLIVLEQSSSLTLMHGSDAAISNATIKRTIRCIVHEDAVLNFNYDESWQDDVCALTNIVIEQQRSSTVRYTHSMSGGARVTQRLSFMASGIDTYSDIRGKYALTGKGVADITTLQYHDAKHTKSKLLFKSIVRDSGSMMHNGTIVITANGVHTESTQNTHTLLLGDKACAFSVPNIEVSTHEVHCGHGSAIGRLDEEQLWYLQARGLSYAQAEQCLINGFFNDVL